VVSLARLVSPTDKQREFLEAIATHDFVLYGGEGGGGKSYILRWWLVLFLIWTYKVLGLRNVRVGLFSEDYPTLRDRQIIKMRSEFPHWLGNLTKGETWDFTLHEEYGGGQIALRNLDDPSKYASSEFAAIAVEELTKNPLSIFNDLRWRIRWPGIYRKPFAAGANPGEPGSLGAVWVKKYWITKEYPAEFYADAASGRKDITKEFKFVAAKASDNPHLDDSYWERLLSLPPDMAKRVAHGDWDAPVGLYYPEFKKDIHVIPHALAMARVERWHQRLLSGDWGYDHPHAFHWHAKNELKEITTHWELWDRQIGEKEVGQRITAAESQFHNLAKLSGFVFSWDAGKLSPRASQDQPKSIEKMISEGLGPRIPRPYPTDSTPGVRLIRARLASQVLQARTWFISDACPKLIQSIEELYRDPDHTEQVLKVDFDGQSIGDDPYDSAVAGLQRMIGVSHKPDEVKIEEKIQAVREQFAARAEPVKIGDPDFFSQFGGKKADKPKR
jgi:hypothetical protein